MIKAAIIIERADITLGGAERSMFELARQIRLFSQESGIAVEPTLLAATGQGNLDDTVVLCGKNSSRRIRFEVFGEALEKHFAENHYDIIHSTLPFNFTDVYQPRGGSYPEAIIRNAASYPNALIKNFKKLSHWTNIRRYTLLKAEAELCRKSSTVIVAALSEYVRRQFKKYYNLPDTRIKLIPNAVETDNWPDNAEAERLRDRIYTKLMLDKKKDPLIMLFAANNFRLKGLDTLFNAISFITYTRKMSRPVFLIVAGNRETDKYQKYAAKLGLSQHVFFAGHVKNIQNAIEISDIAVLPTFYDPCSRFILEALAANKPVITSKYNGASEQFTHNRHGIVLDDPAHTEPLADAVEFYANPVNLEHAVSAISEDNLAEKFSLKNHAKKIVDLYQHILKQTGVI